MKIQLYQQDYSFIFQTCVSVLREMNYSIQNEDIFLGVISGVKTDAQMQIMDLKFHRQIDCVSLAVIPGILSFDYQNIFYDEMNEQVFIENFFRSLKGEPGNDFRLMDDDYLAALPAC